MRKIGTLESARTAETFHRFLRSEGIENKVDHVPPVWEVWVLSDDQLEKAKAELESFKNFPGDKRFHVKHVPPAREQDKPKTFRRSGISEIAATRSGSRPRPWPW